MADAPATQKRLDRSGSWPSSPIAARVSRRKVPRTTDGRQLFHDVVRGAQGYPSSVPPVLAATADLVVVRFHGHSDKWTSRIIYDRFGYKYSVQELKVWAPEVRNLADWARETHVPMNSFIATTR